MNFSDTFTVIQAVSDHGGKGRLWVALLGKAIIPPVVSDFYFTEKCIKLFLRQCVFYGTILLRALPSPFQPDICFFLIYVVQCTFLRDTTIQSISIVCH